MKKNNRLIVSIIASGVGIASLLYSSGSYADPFSLEEEIQPANVVPGDLINRFLNAPGFDNGWIDPVAIVNLGKMIWPIIVAGKPVVDLSTDSASALPGNVKLWSELGEWQTPVSKPFSFELRAMGMQKVRFNYTLVFTYGGSLNGKGRYLSNVAIIPSELNVSWGYKLYAHAQVASITNVGTADDPIAALQMLLTWTIDTPLKHRRFSSAYYVTGVGEFKDLIQPEEALY